MKFRTRICWLCWKFKVLADFIPVLYARVQIEKDNTLTLKQIPGYFRRNCQSLL